MKYVSTIPVFLLQNVTFNFLQLFVKFIINF